ncbi:DUF4376 domain-containing protein [Salinicola sp. RZ23]|uniref:DUF4376 domain-containing protein n=1 Tax=Salinicola sp. RZ23 TaxID=1949087 RepID=UPI000DA18F63|nr:DUF4376 domain-containing protein [Salinicola sp. RZ23]
MALFFSASVLSFFDSAIHREIPEDAVEVSHDEHQAMLEGQTSGQRWAADDTGHPMLVDPPQPTLAELANRQRATIESALAAALRAGMPYTLPGGSEDVIQTRPEEDEANLLGLAIEARDRRAAGDTDASMALRAQSNTVYSLTPAQMISLTDAAKAFKQRLLAKSWELKDAVSAAEAAGDREAIEAVVWEAAT